MTTEPNIRIGDADRDVVIARVKTAYAEGRLRTEELEERIDLIHRARFQADLVPLVADLPNPSSSIVRRSRAGVSGRSSRALGYARPFLFAPIICTIIWLITTPGGYFWPVWVWFGCSIPVIRFVLRSGR